MNDSDLTRRGDHGSSGPPTTSPPAFATGTRGSRLRTAVGSREPWHPARTRAPVGRCAVRPHRPAGGGRSRPNSAPPSGSSPVPSEHHVGGRRAPNGRSWAVTCSTAATRPGTAAPSSSARAATTRSLRRRARPDRAGDAALHEPHIPRLALLVRLPAGDGDERVGAVRGVARAGLRAGPVGAGGRRAAQGLRA